MDLILPCRVLDWKGGESRKSRTGPDAPAEGPFRIQSAPVPRKTGLRILVTAGPTREYLDPVRFLSNASSGRMGFAVARRAAARGHRVTLVTGPVELPDPPGVRVVRVISAAAMAREVGARFATSDAVIMTAAVADYTPSRTARRKLKKTGRPIALRLEPTRDILLGLGRRKGHRVLVGFALESHNLVRRARAKLLRKNLDLIVANRPDTLGNSSIRATLLFRDGREEALPPMSKERLAARLVSEVEQARRRQVQERRSSGR